MQAAGSRELTKRTDVVLIQGFLTGSCNTEHFMMTDNWTGSCKAAYSSRTVLSDGRLEDAIALQLPTMR